MLTRLLLSYRPKTLRLYSQGGGQGSQSGQGQKFMVTAHYIDRDGEKHTIKAEEGTNMLTAAHQNDIDLEGACECSLACSTCHVYVDEKYYALAGGSDLAEEEQDMLDLAFGLQENSHLGCQIVLRPSLEGIVVSLPPATRNTAVDGYKPPKH